MDNHHLTLAFNKTEIVTLSKSRTGSTIPLRVGDEVVTKTAAVRYPGIIIDRKMTFWDQIFCTTAKMTAD